MTSPSLRVLLAVGLLSLFLTGKVWAEPGRLIRVGAFNYYPAIFQDTDGEIKGFYVDALNDLAKQENLRIQYVYGSWDEGLERIQSGNIDVLTSVAYTAERAEFLDYTKTPLLTVWGELYVPMTSDLANITKLQGKTIAVMENDFNGRSFIELTKKFSIKCQVVELSGFDEVFAAVSQKKVDAGVANNTFGMPKQKEYQLRSTGIVFNPFDLHFAVAKGQNAELLALLESTLQRWRHGEDSVYLKAREKWNHGALEKVQVLPPWLRASMAGLGLLGLLAGAFIILLRNRVTRATAALSQREASLRETTEMKRLLLDSAAEGIFGLDNDGRCTFCNTASLIMLGYEQGEQLISHNMHELIHHTSREGKRLSTQDCAILQASRLEQDCHCEDEVYWRADGSSFPVEYWVRPLHRDHRVVGSVVTFVDISDRKQLEASYQFISQSGYKNTAKDFFPALAQHLGQSLDLNFVFISRITEKDRQSQTVASYHKGAAVENFEYGLQGTPCNEALSKIFYCVSKGVRDRFPQAPLLEKFDAESFIGATLWGFDGKPIGLIGGIGQTPLANTKMAESIMKLVSLRAASELERTQAAKVLQQKNQELEHFTYAVSHDLKSPLVTIQTFLGYLLQDQAKGAAEAVEKDIGFISTAAEKMSTLLEELLRMSRVGRLVNPPSQVSFAELVNDALEAVAGAIEKRGVEVQIIDKAITLRGDRTRLTEIWQNLIDNAVKYMGDQPTPRIEIGIKDSLQEQIFYVRDNGIGIDPRHSHKVFDLFQKLAPHTPGTGLGLALVKKVVELNNGRIWMESAGSGHGSCFLFTLPKAFNP